jgi:hypothetical protein
MDATLLPTRYAAVTPSDTTIISPCMGLYVGGSGNVVVTGSDDVTATFVVNAGQTLPGRFKKVTTATTAQNIVALYG